MIVVKTEKIKEVQTDILIVIIHLPKTYLIFNLNKFLTQFK